MIDHMGIRTATCPQSRRFYDAVFAAMGGGMCHRIPLEYASGIQVLGFGRAMPIF